MKPPEPIRRAISHAIAAALACAGLASPFAAHAIAPAAAGQLALPAPLLRMQAAMSAPRAIALLQPGAGRPGGLQVLDLTQPEKPSLQGFVPLPGATHTVVSADGKRALVLLQTEAAKPREATRHTIVTVDLGDGTAPRETARTEVTARKVLLAAGAGAWVASQQQSGTANEWTAVVRWLDGARAPAVIAEKYGPVEKISPGGDFIAWQNYSSQSTVSDLRGGTPAAHEQDYGFYGRAHCAVAVLDSGYLLAEDTRAPRMAMYAPAQGMPRVAVLPHDGTLHCDAIAQDAAGNLLMAGDHGVVRRASVAQPATPGFNGEWQLPPGLTALTASSNVMYAGGPGADGKGASVLRLFRMDLGNVSDVDWPLLEKVHAGAMARHAAAVRKGARDADARALAELEAAGAAMAPDSPLLNIAPRSAAAILDDYGYLLRAQPGRYALAEFASKRAHILDPQRASATLRLADLWAGKLPSVPDLALRERRRTDIEALYRQYVALGGKTDARILAYAKGDPAEKADNLCDAIALYANAGRLGDLVADRATGVTLGTREVDLVFGSEGTAHVPAAYAWDAGNDTPLEDSAVPTPGKDLGGGDELGLIAYRGVAQVLHYRDMDHPVETAQLIEGGGANVSCRFKVTTVEKTGVSAAEPALCRRIADGKSPAAIAFAGRPRIDDAAVKERHGESSVEGTAVLDFANDGSRSLLAQLQLSSGAGAGCEAQFFDVLDASGKKLASGPRQALLMRLQGADASARYPVNCGNEARFFRDGGKTYFETKPAAWPPTDNGDKYHRVVRIDNAKVRDVCGFRFESSVTVAR